MDQRELYRSIPKVDMLLELSEIQDLLLDYDRRLVLEAIRLETEKLRERIAQGMAEEQMLEEVTNLPLSIRRRTEKMADYGMKRVINATGTILHTNLGRAPLGQEQMERLSNLLTGYSNLEYDLEAGERGERCAHFESWICRMTGAESAVAVNNNAAAVLLALTALAKGKEVVISRGEMIEIGGQFRIPDVMEQSGATLREVGTTNRTRLADYEKAVAWNTGAILKVHTSNYKIIGFTQSTPVRELSSIGEKQGVPVIVDLGSGSLLDLSKYGLPHEPTVQETIEEGADLVCFSADKLLGGPQAGIIAGRKKYVAALKKHPMMRALRIDKFTAAALEMTFRAYLREEEACFRIPILNMMTRPITELEQMAWKLKEMLKPLGGQYVIQIEDCMSQMGGGALPEEYFPSKCITFTPKGRTVAEAEQLLRRGSTPVIVRVTEEKLVLDLRTVLKEDFDILGQVLLQSLGGIAL